MHRRKKEPVILALNLPNVNGTRRREHAADKLFENKRRIKKNENQTIEKQGVVKA